MPEPQKAFLFNKNSQPGENTPRDEGRPFDNLRSSHQQASLKDMTKGTQKMTPGRQGHPRTGKEHVYPLCPGVEGQSSHATRDCSRPEGSSGGRGGGWTENTPGPGSRSCSRSELLAWGPGVHQRPGHRAMEGAGILLLEGWELWPMWRQVPRAAGREARGAGGGRFPGGGAVGTGRGRTMRGLLMSHRRP